MPWPDEEAPDWPDCHICGQSLDECECIWPGQNNQPKMIYDEKNQSEIHRQ